ncbi:MAG: peptide ABC transporter substrate-binding protein, partial [Oligosphaeraceae bacterium]|nr:peptide ABC transporter substrate-binding protein [Oligosphaeraceae bacterium]
MSPLAKRVCWTVTILGAALLSCVALWLFCTNDPWPAGWTASNTFFASYASPIKSLDPATAYYVHESAILDNVVEAPLDYDYLARPYRLIPRLLTAIPEPRYFAADGTELPGDPPPESVARVEYLLTLLPDLQYQPHPCFAQQADGSPEYWGEGRGTVPAKVKSPQDYPRLATRTLQALDF